MANILVIEDEENLRVSIHHALTRAGHTVAQAGGLTDARKRLADHAFDLVLTDVQLSDGNGIEIVNELRAEGFDGVISIMTGYGSVEQAVGAMRDGADDYIQKPLSLQELTLQVDRWLDRRRVAQRLRLFERIEQHREGTEQILGESRPWLQTLELAQRVATIPLDDATARAGEGLPAILLLGETGTGKGLLARYIHNTATAGIPTQSRPPMVHINCSALPASLIESELFGHDKGAFTDAKEARPGLFEMAQGGTVFLDEIADLPLELQAKLLVVVEQGTYRRVGGRRERRVRARVIAATNQDLTDRVADRSFRQDLYFRLATFTVQIPPLQDRGDDAVLIARQLVTRFGPRFARPDLALGSDAEQAIAQHTWPGNVRELVNAVQRAAMLAHRAVITPTDLGLSTRDRPDPAARPTGSAGIGQAPGDLRFDFSQGTHTAEQVELTLMKQALEHTRGNVSQAAKLIGMQRSSFRYRIDRYQLDDFVRELAGR